MFEVLRCLFLNSMNFVLSGFIESLFIQNQLNIFSSSWLMVASVNELLLLQCLQEVCEKHRDTIKVVSSAKQITLNRSEILFRSLMYIRNKSGPKTLPCGTPVVELKKVESVPLYETN